jgi:hypothetical protein
MLQQVIEALEGVVGGHMPKEGNQELMVDLMSV